MSKRTITSSVLEYWKSQGRVCFYSDLKAAYLKASKELGFHAQEEYVGMNMTRLLKKHGIKVGTPGSRTPWVLRNN